MNGRDAADDYPVVFRRLIHRSILLASQQADDPDWKPQAGRIDQLLFALDNALWLPSSWPTALPLLARLAPAMEQAGLRKEWLAYLEQGIACCEISGDSHTAAHLALERGILLERLGRLAEAQEGLVDSLNRYRRCDDARGLARAHNRLAYVLRGRRHAGEAAYHVEQALQTLTPSDPELHYCQLVLGLLAYDRFDWSAAEHHLRRCVDGCQGSGEMRLCGMALINLAAVHMCQAQYAIAEECLHSAASLVSNLDDTANNALIHLNLGVLYLFRNKPEAAIPELQVAEAVYRQLQDEQRLALIYSNLALAFWEANKHQAAEEHFGAALQRFTALEDHPNWVDLLLDFCQFYQERRRLDEAQACLQQAEALLFKIQPASVRKFEAERIVFIRSALKSLHGAANDNSQISI